MSQQHRSPAGTAPGAVPGAAPGAAVPAVARPWLDALGVVVAGLVVMGAVAALGLWLAGAAELPGGAFIRVIAATLVMSVGGSVRLEGGAGAIAAADAGISVIPLSVSLAGALVMAAVFLRPLRFHAVAGGTELLGRIVRTVLLWLLAVALIALVARHTFTVDLGDSLVNTISSAIGATPVIGFAAAVLPTLGFGLLWLLAVLALAFAVSRKAPLPSRLVHYQELVRPPAFAMVTVLLLYVVLGVVAAVAVVMSRGSARDTFAVVLLGLPNLAWLAFGLGLGASWDGHVNGGIGLPMPHALTSVLRTPLHQDTTLNLSSLTHYDGRFWVLPVVAAVLLTAGGFVMAARSTAGVRHWQHAVRMAVAMAVTMLVIGLLTRVSAHYGLSLLGVGDTSESGGLGSIADLLGSALSGGGDGGLGGGMVLRPDLLVAVPLAAAWGLAAGFLGSLLATRVRRRGETGPS